MARLGGGCGPELGRAASPRGQHELGIGGTVVLPQRPGQIPRVQVPLGAGRARHRTHRDLGPPVTVVRQVPGQREPPAVGPGGLGERRDVLGAGGIRQRSELGRVLPGQLAGERVRGCVGGQQPGEPAGRSVIEVLVVVVGDAPQVTGQVHRPPFRTRRGGRPRRVSELRGEFTDDGHAVAVGVQYCPILLWATAALHGSLSLPVGPGNRFAKPGGASVPELRSADKAYAARKNQMTTSRRPG